MNRCCKGYLNMDGYNHCPTCGTKFVEDKVELPFEISNVVIDEHGPNGYGLRRCLETLNQIIQHLKQKEGK